MSSVLTESQSKELLNGFLGVKNQGAEAILRFFDSLEVTSLRENWQYLGGKEGNAGIVFAQASDALGCFYEIQENAIEAVKDLKYEEANAKAFYEGKEFKKPESFSDSIKEYFGIDLFDASTLTEEKINSLSKYVQVIATGSKTKPNLAVFDRGIGQVPSKFIKTFMSLNDANKEGRDDCHGIYNMGSSGSLRYCGEGIRFTITCSPLQDKKMVSFSFVKRIWLNRSPAFVYFAPGGEVPTFELEEGIELGLLNEEKFTTGSYVEMYSYELNKEFQGDITKNMFKEMQQSLFKVGLPFTMVERRFTSKKPHVKTFTGNFNRFHLESHLIEKEVSLGVMNVAPFGDFHVNAYVFKNKEEAENIIGKHHVLFTNNGQTQERFKVKFLKNEAGLKCLAERLLIHVDCSDVDKFSKIIYLFDSSRDGLVKNDYVKDMLELLAYSLKNNETLAAMEQELRNKYNNLSKSSNEDIMKELMKEFPITDEMKKMFTDMGVLNFANGNARRNPGKEHHLTDDVTRTRSIVSLSEGKSKVVRSIPLDGERSISFVPNQPSFVTKEDTEVKFQLVRFKKPNPPKSLEDELFDEPEESIDETIEEEVKPETTKKETNDKIKNLEDYFNTTTDIESGVVNINLKPRKELLSVGDELKFEATISYGLEKSYSAVITIKISDKNKDDKRKYKKNERGSGTPSVVEIYKDDWGTVGFDENSLIKLEIDRIDKERVEITDIKINMDNGTLLKQLNELDPALVNIDKLKKQFLFNVFVDGLTLYPYFFVKETEDSDETAEDELASALQTKVHTYAKWDSMKLMEEIA